MVPEAALLTSLIHCRSKWVPELNDYVEKQHNFEPERIFRHRMLLRSFCRAQVLALMAFAAESPEVRFSVLIRKYYNVFYSNDIEMIHRRAAENAEG